MSTNFNVTWQPYDASRIAAATIVFRQKFVDKLRGYGKLIPVVESGVFGLKEAWGRLPGQEKETGDFL